MRATKPTVIGDDFEAAVEAALAHLARHADGDWLQNVSRKVGEATDAKSGDFDYHLAGGGIIAIEARNRQGTITLGGKTGVLEELKKAKANRKADFAVYCVAHEEALPDQVGYLQRYDDRIVCLLRFPWRDPCARGQIRAAMPDSAAGHSERGEREHRTGCHRRDPA